MAAHARAEAPASGHPLTRVVALVPQLKEDVANWFLRRDSPGMAAALDAVRFEGIKTVSELITSELSPLSLAPWNSRPMSLLMVTVMQV